MVGLKIEGRSLKIPDDRLYIWNQQMCTQALAHAHCTSIRAYSVYGIII